MRHDVPTTAAVGLASLLFVQSSLAAPVVLGVVSSGDSAVANEILQAFTEGASELAPGLATGLEHPLNKERGLALAALSRGEEEYLKARLRTAEKLLASASDGLLADPSTLDAEAATRALVLLAQTQIAGGKLSAAEKTLERGLRAIPRFPNAAVDPPPEVVALVERLRPRIQTQLTGKLSVQSEVPGTLVFLGGTPLGTAPLTAGELPALRLTARLFAAGEPLLVKEVDLSLAPAELGLTAVSAGLRKMAATALIDRDEPATALALAALASAHEATEVCFAMILEDGPVVVARVSQDGRRYLAGHRQATPTSTADWRALGRHCGGTGAGDTASGEDVRRQIFGGNAPAVDSPSEGGLNRPVAFSLMGAGALSLGAATYFGVSALDAEARYGSGRTPAAAQDARADARDFALYADLGIVAGVAAIVGGIIVLWTAEEEPVLPVVE